MNKVMVVCVPKLYQICLLLSVQQYDFNFIVILHEE